MHIGVDVGGTHTDAVLLDEAFKIASVSKTLTLPDILDTLKKVLSDLLKDASLGHKIDRLAISTTLGLNSVLTGQADPVGALVTSGPGLPFDLESLEVPARLLSATQDHRGVVLRKLREGEAREAARELVASDKVSALVVSSKFGPKNPVLEEEILGEIKGVAPGPVISAAKLFGSLNFNRRLHSAVLNAAVKRLYGRFLDDLQKTVEALGLLVREILILKSDGGIMSLSEAREKPVNALAAGPSASLLGLWSLYRDEAGEDILMADMGGTSTDLAILSRGAPLLIPEGLKIAGKDTLVRGLLTSSLALGGDTDLLYEDNVFKVLPRRRGLALALDPEGAEDRLPTLTDALNVLGRAKVGDVEISFRAFQKLGDPVSFAKMAVDAVLSRLKNAADRFIEDINLQPVHTVNEFLVDWKIAPKRIVLLGGPAAAMAPLVSERFDMPAEAPPESTYANALGAALARPTFEADLYADTILGVMSIPTLGVVRPIGREYNLDVAKKELLEAIKAQERARLTLAESFNQVSDSGHTGRVIRVKAQGAPGLMI
jgi:N-methylhydantoinase A/oxoprolinase/acetone carboxylase beta subunit